MHAVIEDYFTNMKEDDQTELFFDSKGKLGFKNRKCTYSSDRLTFSNIRGRTSHQIYRLTLPLISP